MDNVVTVVFDNEAEAYKAFTELRQAPVGKGYTVAEAALLKREDKAINVVETFDAGGVTSDDTATGILVGSIVGILGGPLGILLGAGAGALIGSAYDRKDTIDSASMLEVTASKLYDGETAIIALVQEDEPAFDAPFASYQTTIIRHFAVDVIKEVDLAREATADFANQVHAQLSTERKAEKAEAIEERKAKVEARFAEVKAQHEERKATLDEAKGIANAQFASSTKEMLGKE